MIRVGLVGFDTSHVVEFTKRLNHVDIEPEQWVDGAQVVAGYPGTSDIVPAELVDEYTRTLVDKYGLRLVERPEDLIGQVSAVMVEYQGGGRHMEAVRPFLTAGIPTFVDKPFACSVADAWEMAHLARRHGTPLFSSSSLRYAPEVVAVRQDAGTLGSVMGAEAYSPAVLHPRNPGLFHYGIHAVETLYALMGPGCRAVVGASVEKTDVVVGEWEDGRLGVVRGIRAGQGGLGFAAYCERGICATPIQFRPIYSALLRQVVEMFRTGQPPLPIDETIEITTFIVAALRSARNGGRRVSLAEV